MLTGRSLRPMWFAASAIVIACGAAEVLAPPFTPESAVLKFGVPPGWVVAGSQPQAYTYGTDQTNHHGGTSSAYLLRLSSVQRTGFVTITQFIKADDYRGKRVRLSAWVAHKAIEGGAGGGVWIRIDGPTTFILDNMLSRPLTGTAEWHQVGDVVDVPANAIGISFGCLLDGDGVLNVDDFSLEVVGSNVPPTVTTAFANAVGQDSVAVARGYANAQRSVLNPGFESVAGLSNRAPAGR